jgi:pimeloyl-ACP methyl ester carboxylesterase
MKNSAFSPTYHAAPPPTRVATSFGPVACRVYRNRMTPRALLCVHGFDRTSRDFIPMARAMRAHCNVICLDLPGRGHSAWLADKALYRPETYADVAAQAIVSLGFARVDVFGSSLGGHVGMLLAANTALVDRLVVNDIAPFLHRAMLKGLARLTRWRRAFDSLEEAEAFLRVAHTGAGPMSDAEWASYAANCTRTTASAGVEFDYDPDICVPLEDETAGDRDLWDVWRSIACPALVVRGRESRVLTAGVAQLMAAEKQGTQLIEFADAGHPPLIHSPQRIAAIAGWLFAPPTAPSADHGADTAHAAAERRPGMPGIPTMCAAGGRPADELCQR